MQLRIVKKEFLTEQWVVTEKVIIVSVKQDNRNFPWTVKLNYNKNSRILVTLVGTV